MRTAGVIGLMAAAVVTGAATAIASAAEPIDLGSRRELMVDRFLIEKMEGASLVLHEPRDEGTAFKFDQPWEGPFSAYVTVLRDGAVYRAYYRGKTASAADGEAEVTCMAESSDGVHWTKPKLGVVTINGSADNNVILMAKNVCHNFAPMVDANSSASPAARYKAIAGTASTGLVAFGSPDGVHWSKLRDEPLLTTKRVQAEMPGVGYMFDSQNLAFWSPAERKYLMYFRVFKDKVRRIARAESTDFVSWTNLQLMEYRTADGSPAPVEHLYINQTQPYFRAERILISLPARFMGGRQVLTPEEAKEIGVNPKFFNDTSDAVFQTTRGGNFYDRTFLSSFIRPGIGHSNWVSRTNYPAWGVVQTGEHEMSCYVTGDYAQPTSHLKRFSMRLDGFASLRAPYEGGQMVTKPLKFTGKKLMMNYATSAAGEIRVEIQDVDGKPITGFSAGYAVPTIGNEIERAARWRKGNDVSELAGQTVRLRFVMKDADLFAFRFSE